MNGLTRLEKVFTSQRTKPRAAMPAKILGLLPRTRNRGQVMEVFTETVTVVVFILTFAAVLGIGSKYVG